MSTFPAGGWFSRPPGPRSDILPARVGLRTPAPLGREPGPSLHGSGRLSPSPRDTRTLQSRPTPLSAKHLNQPSPSAATHMIIAAQREVLGPPTTWPYLKARPWCCADAPLGSGGGRSWSTGRSILIHMLWTVVSAYEFPRKLRGRSRRRDETWLI